MTLDPRQVLCGFSQISPSYQATTPQYSCVIGNNNLINVWNSSSGNLVFTTADKNILIQPSCFSITETNIFDTDDDNTSSQHIKHHILAVGTRDGLLYVWHVETGNLVEVFHHSSGTTEKPYINGLVFNSTGDMVYTAGSGKGINQWNLKAKVFASSIMTPFKNIQHIDISPQDKYIVVSLTDRVACISMETLKIVALYSGFDKQITNISICNRIINNQLYFAVSTSSHESITVWPLISAEVNVDEPQKATTFPKNESPIGYTFTVNKPSMVIPIYHGISNLHCLSLVPASRPAKTTIKKSAIGTEAVYISATNLEGEGIIYNITPYILDNKYDPRHIKPCLIQDHTISSNRHVAIEKDDITRIHTQKQQRSKNFKETGRIIIRGATQTGAVSDIILLSLQQAYIQRYSPISAESQLVQINNTNDSNISSSTVPSWSPLVSISKYTPRLHTAAATAHKRSLDTSTDNTTKTPQLQINQNVHGVQTNKTGTSIQTSVVPLTQNMITSDHASFNINDNMMMNDDTTIASSSSASNTLSEQVMATKRQRLLNYSAKLGQSLAQRLDDERQTLQYRTNPHNLLAALRNKTQQTTPSSVQLTQQLSLSAHPGLLKGSLASLLTQALQSNDDKLLEECINVAAARGSRINYVNEDMSYTDCQALFSQGKKVPMLQAQKARQRRMQHLEATISGIHPLQIIPLLNKITERLAQTPARSSEYLPWLRCILRVHLVPLLARPESIHHLSGLYNIIQHRIRLLSPMLRLKGRLEVLLQHSTRVRNASIANNKDDTTDTLLNSGPARVYLEDQQKHDRSTVDKLALSLYDKDVTSSSSAAGLNNKNKRKLSSTTKNTMLDTSDIDDDDDDDLLSQLTSQADGMYSDVFNDDNIGYDDESLMLNGEGEYGFMNGEGENGFNNLFGAEGEFNQGFEHDGEGEWAYEDDDESLLHNDDDNIDDIDLSE